MVICNLQKVDENGNKCGHDIEAECHQVFANVRAVLEAGGAGPEHLVRLTWYVVDRVEYNARLRELGAVYREVLGKNFPAMACAGGRADGVPRQDRDRGNGRAARLTGCTPQRLSA